jgi:chorismate mutase
MTKPSSHAPAEGPLDAIRRELQQLDAQLVDALLARAAATEALPSELAPADTPPDTEAATRFPAAWRSLCAAYAHTVLPLLTVSVVPTSASCQFPSLEGSGTGPPPDHAVLAMLWRRTVAGARVADAKMAATPERFMPAIRRGDRAALDAAITHPEVEERVITRAVERARERLDSGPSLPAAIGEIFRRVVIPFTKEVQIEALLDSGRAGGHR